jgi:hypothetical protein
VRPGRAADHSPPSSAEVMEEYSYNSTQPLGHTGPVTGLIYLYLVMLCYVMLCSQPKKLVDLNSTGLGFVIAGRCK